MSSKQNKSTEQKTQEFFKTVQAGDIALLKIFEEAIAVFGYTKVGKTTSCHILSNSIMKSQNQNGEIILKPTTKKYQTAIVGATYESETQIPNIFYPTFIDLQKTKQVALLDQPGYADTFGFHRIFSNGYFHYRTFSKTPKLKFILAFDYKELSGVADKVKRTIIIFLSTFKNYQQIEKNILNATSFLITKVDIKVKISDIEQRLQKLIEGDISNMIDEDQKNFKNIITEMIQKKKIFLIQKPQKQHSQTKETKILSEIYHKTQFWVRKVEKNVADMSKINFSVGHEILNQLRSFKTNKVFKANFNYFMNYMQDRINKFLYDDKYSFLGIVRCLEQDAKGSVQSHSFREGMKKFIENNYKFNQNFKTEREKIEVSLFKLNQLSDSIEPPKNNQLNSTAQLERKQREREIKMTYFIKKFKVLDFIVAKSGQIDNQVQRSIQQLENISYMFIQIFRKFNTLRIQIADSKNIIYKYSYLIQRLIEEAKIITLILFQDHEMRDEFDKQKEGMVEIYRPLRDTLFSAISDIKVEDLKRQYIETVNAEDFDIVNEQIISFFQSIQVNDQKGKKTLEILVLKFSESIFKKIRATDREKYYAAIKLLEMRNARYSYFQNIINSGTKHEREQSIEQIIKLTNYLGKMMSNLNRYQHARYIYDSVNNVSQAIKCFQAQLQTLTDSNEASRRLLMSYGQYAQKRGRSELALKCYQDAYALSTTYQEIREVSKAIVNIGTKNLISSNIQEHEKTQQEKYIERLNNKYEMFSPIPDNITNRIRDNWQDILSESKFI